MKGQLVKRPLRTMRHKCWRTSRMARYLDGAWPPRHRELTRENPVKLWKRPGLLIRWRARERLYMCRPRPRLQPR